MLVYRGVLICGMGWEGSWLGGFYWGLIWADLGGVWRDVLDIGSG